MLSNAHESSKAVTVQTGTDLATSKLSILFMTVLCLPKVVVCCTVTLPELRRKCPDVGRAALGQDGDDDDDEGEEASGKLCLTGGGGGG